MVSFKERLRKAQTEIAQQDADPLRAVVERNVRGQNAIGTAPLLDLLGLPKTTANGRRLAQTMRSLGFVPIKSRRLMPGGYTDTVTRGWARPLRDPVDAQTFLPPKRPQPSMAAAAEIDLLERTEQKQ